MVKDIAIANTPGRRRLRVYSFDPSLGSKIATRGINEITIDIPWEHGDEGTSALAPGPVGEYIEVVDVDPASGVFYEPVDLNSQDLLAQDGLQASETNPQFHQQMVYAVAMATIHRFEEAFGRRVFWSDHVVPGTYDDQFVRRLRIYPHALRARNAYYSPAKKALLFGYFPVTSKDRDNTPGTTVFTCLAHDIIAHEMTHALLDGIHPRFNEASNPDVHGFHEAFADIVALFQRFSYPGVLESQIARTRGNLAGENMLAQLAQQFGKATGRGSALRDALGEIDDETREWQPRSPDPRALETKMEPHERGAILVAAVFRAFTLVYNTRIADLFRIATQGTGVLPDGAIHPDLAGRLAEEARHCAERVLSMCIRAADYCPPVDITFGDYLRAIITADLDIDPDDEMGFRVAFIESFRDWGIYPHGIKSMSVASLRWPNFEMAGAMTTATEDAKTAGGKVTASGLRKGRESSSVNLMNSVGGLFSIAREVDVPEDASSRIKSRKTMTFKNLDPRSERFELWSAADDNRYLLWRWLNELDNRELTLALGLVMASADAPPTVYRNRWGNPTIEVHAVRPIVRRTDHFGDQVHQVVEVTQRRRGYFSLEEQKKKDERGTLFEPSEHGDFIYRTGCTFFINQHDWGEIPWVIRTAGTVSDDGELDRMRRFLTGEDTPDRGEPNAFYTARPRSLRLGGGPDRDEPFALLHDHEGD